MTLAHQLSAEFTRFTELRRRLIEADPEIDETTLLDTLEGATSLHEAVGQVLREALAEEAMADGLKARVAQSSSALSPGQAHDFAAKAAETDATKRALMTFGNAFGLGADWTRRQSTPDISRRSAPLRTGKAG